MRLLLALALIASLNYLPRQSNDFRITYEVAGKGTKAAKLTYKNGEGDTVQETVRLPWSKTFTARGGAFLSILAQNQRGGGSITATIKVDDEVAKTATSKGGYAIVTVHEKCCD